MLCYDSFGVHWRGFVYVVLDVVYVVYVVMLFGMTVCGMHKQA